MKKPRAIASGAGAVAPPEFCHADSTRAGLAGAKSEPRSGALQVAFPLKTVNPLNRREHWGERCRRVKAERDVTGWYLSTIRKKPAFPLVVLLTRESVRSLDCDAVPASMKAVRDEIATWLGVDDADPRITWRYDQRKASSFGVEIEFQGREHG